MRSEIIHIETETTGISKITEISKRSKTFSLLDNKNIVDNVIEPQKFTKREIK